VGSPPGQKLGMGRQALTWLVTAAAAICLMNRHEWITRHRRRRRWARALRTRRVQVRILHSLPEAVPSLPTVAVTPPPAPLVLSDSTHTSAPPPMPISQDALEAAIRNALPVAHLEVTDESSGCGENYAVLVVSDAFEGKTTLFRHRFSEHSPTVGSYRASGVDASCSQRGAEGRDCADARVLAGACPLAGPGSLLMGRIYVAQKTFTPKQYQAYLAKSA
jgi:hypothetical protein